MHGMSAAQRRRGRFGDAEVTHLARGDEFAHRAPRFFDRHTRVDAVLVIEVDAIDAEPFQRCVAGAVYVLRSAIDADPAAIGPPFVAELGRENDFVTPTCYGA